MSHSGILCRPFQYFSAEDAWTHNYDDRTACGDEAHWFDDRELKLETDASNANFHLITIEIMFVNKKNYLIQ